MLEVIADAAVTGSRSKRVYRKRERYVLEFFQRLDKKNNYVTMGEQLADGRLFPARLFY